MAKIILKEGSPVVVNKKERGLIRGCLGNGLLVIDMGMGKIVNVPPKEVRPALCVGAVVAVKTEAGGCNGKIVKHRRGKEEKCLVNFNGERRWLKASQMRIIKPAPPRMVVESHPCRNAPTIDYGIGVASCTRCRKWPILNRGCSQCELKYCSSCLPDHLYDSSEDDDELPPPSPTSGCGIPPDYHNPDVRPAFSCIRDKGNAGLKSGKKEVQFCSGAEADEGYGTAVRKSPPPQPEYVQDELPQEDGDWVVLCD
eukprot:TRINITY_DN6881_c0_g2_i1.p1 TRINITY_DN6881_c0_g2~~TRINITY_DN6881_c0_g2_i1.p1  ORF type:complete len:285 (+),score=47.33 TRINITY_DN6881_c0_g2_i1:92-856(+)